MERSWVTDLARFEGRGIPAGRVAGLLKPNRAGDGKRKTAPAAIAAHAVSGTPEGWAAGVTPRRHGAISAPAGGPEGKT